MTADLHIGLIFIDFQTGDTLQLAGTGEVVWHDCQLAGQHATRRGPVNLVSCLTFVETFTPHPLLSLALRLDTQLTADLDSVLFCSTFAFCR